MRLKEILFLILAISAINAEYVSYANYKVYKIVPGSDQDVQIIMDLKKQKQYNFWSEIVAVNSDVRIMVSPEKQPEFETYFESVGIFAKVVIKNVQEEIHNQLRRPATRSTKYAWDYYQNLDEINTWLDQVISDYPNVITPVTLGVSHEGRTVRGIKIDYKKQADPVIGMIEGGIHSREWISPATVTYIINEFLTSTDPDVRFMAESIVWHIFPVINPDGYVYSFTNNRMWRKNRNPEHHVPSCDHWGEPNDLSNGVDLNRNFDFMWMTVGASDDPCDLSFAGASGFSEVETRNVRDYVLKIQQEGRMIYYFAYHSFGQWVMLPYNHAGGTEVLLAPNYGDLYEIAVRGAEKLQAVYGSEYIIGTLKDILGAQFSGSSFDWVRGVADVPITFLFELRDTEEYGFLLPPEQIIPNCQETMAGLIEIEKVTRGLGYYHNSGEKVITSFVVLLLALFIAL